MTAPTVDFGLRSDDYAAHRPGFPDSFYERLGRHLDPDGLEALDLGTGPGVVALELARRGASVTGIDVAEAQVEAARRRAETLGLADRAAFRVARAEETGLGDDSVDLVTAGQCWPWFDHEAALREVARVLRPGGHLVVAHYCYLPTRDRVAAASEELVYAYNPGWKLGGWHGIYAHQIDALQTAELGLVEQFCYDHLQPFSHEAWRGRMRTCNGVGSGGMTEDQVRAYDAALAELLARECPEEPFHVLHRVWAVVLQRRA